MMLEKLINYWGESPLSMVGILLEVILRNRIYQHLGKQGLIKIISTDLCMGKLSVTNLLVSFEEVNMRIVVGRIEDVVYMIYSKAFKRSYMVD